MSYLHGASAYPETPEYMAWKSMKQRCLNPKRADYRYYGGAGVTICKEWAASFACFLDAIGKRPSPAHTLDRIDVNRGYEPGNVRWATRAVQASNQKRTHYMEHNGLRLTWNGWAQALGVSRHFIRYRAEAGWPISRIIESAKESRDVL